MGDFLRYELIARNTGTARSTEGVTWVVISVLDVVHGIEF